MNLPRGVKPRRATRDQFAQLYKAFDDTRKKCEIWEKLRETRKEVAGGRMMQQSDFNNFAKQFVACDNSYTAERMLDQLSANQLASLALNVKKELDAKAQAHEKTDSALARSATLDPYLDVTESDAQTAQKDSLREEVLAELTSQPTIEYIDHLEKELARYILRHFVFNNFCKHQIEQITSKIRSKNIVANFAGG